MAWTAPMTAVANNVFTAADFNTYVRDNLLETMPAKATEAGQYFVSDGPHSLVARKIGYSTLTSSTPQIIANPSDWVDITGGTVTITTGSEALVHCVASLEQDDTDVAGILSIRVSGATTLTADDHRCRVIWDNATANNQARMGSWGRLASLNPGSNVFRLVATTGSTTTVSVSRAQLIVIPLS